MSIVQANKETFGSLPHKNNKQEWMQYAIHWLLHDAEIPKEECDSDGEIPDPVELVEEEFPLSSLLFPCVVRIYKVGSRAEKTNVFFRSDKDNIFEIGPGAVTCYGCDGFRVLFFYRKTKHDGFYQILDRNDDYLYPKLFQIKAGSVLHSQKDWLYKTGETKAAVTWGGEDQILSLRLKDWPPEIVESLGCKLKWLKVSHSDLTSRYKKLSMYHF